MHMTGRELHDGLAPVISAPSLPHLWTGSQAGAARPLLLTATFIFAPSLCVPCPGTDTMVILTSLGQPGLWPHGQVWGGEHGATCLPHLPSHSACPSPDGSGWALLSCFLPPACKRPRLALSSAVRSFLPAVPLALLERALQSPKSFCLSSLSASPLSALFFVSRGGCGLGCPILLTVLIKSLPLRTRPD